MVKSELVKRSPLRILEKSLHGGLGKGNIAVLASRKGVGKTACLVHIATDKLLQGKHIIHVSFSGRTDHIISWYEDIFSELAKKRSLESAMEVHDEIIRNRVIMNFNQDGVRTEQMIKSLRAMIVDGHFAADALIIDGYNLSRCDAGDMEQILEFARELGLEIWLTASLKGDDPLYDERGIPLVVHNVVNQVSVVITLKTIDKKVQLKLVKDHEMYPNEDLHLMLDPKTFLIAEE